MKTTMLCLAVIAMMACGCDRTPRYRAAPAADAWAVNSANDQAVRQAIVRQSTLYPYHFIDNSAELTPLGMSDLATLVSHFQRYPGQLSIRRGAAEQWLYDLRVQEVTGKLRTARVDTDRMTLADMPAEGDGMPAGSIIVIMAPGGDAMDNALPQ